MTAALLGFATAFRRLLRLEQTGAHVLATDAREWTGPLPAKETVVLKTEQLPPVTGGTR